MSADFDFRAFRVFRGQPLKTGLRAPPIPPMNKVILFENKDIRRIWSEERKRWLFAVVDIVAVLSESRDSAVYWRVLKHRPIRLLKKARRSDGPFSFSAYQRDWRGF